MPEVLHGTPAQPVEERAIRLAMAVSLAGVVAKVTAGVLTGSMALISSAVDSTGDLLVSTANLFIVRYGHRPPDEDHNYGHAKIEGLGAMFEGGFVFASGLFVIYETARKVIEGEASHDPGIGIAVMVPLLFLTSATVLYLRRVARRTGSLVLKSDALHYLTDVWVNVGVLVALVLVRLTGRAYIDWIVSFGIAVFMMVSSLSIVKEGFDVLMDKSLDPELVSRISALLAGCTRLDSFHELRTRRGKIPFVDFHAVVRADMTAQELHELYDELRDAVRAIAGPQTRLQMHADPDTAPDSEPSLPVSSA